MSRAKVSNKDTSTRGVFKSRHWTCFIKDVLRNSEKLAGIHLRLATLLKKKLWHQRFPRIFKNF